MTPRHLPPPRGEVDSFEQSEKMAGGGLLQRAQFYAAPSPHPSTRSRARPTSPQGGGKEKRIPFFVLLFTLCFFLPAHAAQWTVDKAKSHLGFSVQWQDHPLRGEFKSWSADIAFDPADLEHAKATVKVDIASVTVGSDEMDQGIKGAQGFDAGNYSTATFETTWFRATGKNAYEARGNLTLRGVTRAVTLPFKLDIKGDTAHMTGTAALTRTDFQIGMGQWATDNPVARAVTVTIDLTAKKTK